MPLKAPKSVGCSSGYLLAAVATVVSLSLCLSACTSTPKIESLPDRALGQGKFSIEENEKFQKHRSLLISEIENLKKSQHSSRCEEFAVLTGDGSFPLQDLAQILHRRNCRSEAEPLLFSEQDLASPYLLAMLKWTEASLEKSPHRLQRIQWLHLNAKYNSQKAQRRQFAKTLFQEIKSLNKLDKNRNTQVPMQNQAPIQEALDFVSEELPWLFPDSPQTLTTALALRDERKFADSDRLLLDLVKQSTNGEERFQLRDHWRQNAKIQGDKRRNLQRARKLVQETERDLKLSSPPKSTTLVEAKLSFAKTLWTEERTRQAIQVLEKLLSAEPELGNEANFILGRIYQEKKNYARAKSYFNAALANAASSRSKSNSATQVASAQELADRVNWQKAWMLYNQELWEEARSTLAQSLADFEKDEAKAKESTSERAKLRFWLAKTLQQQARTDANFKIAPDWQSIAQLDPYGYYGQMAVIEMAPQISLPPISAETLRGNAAKATALPPSISKKASWLLFLEDRDLLESYLKRETSLSPEEKLQISILAGQTKTAVLTWARFGSEQKNNILNSHLSDFYPQPFRTEIDEAAKKFKVPAEVILSIMRQESLFDTEARSPMDAFGLMQVLPKQALWRIHHHHELYEPRLNIQSGTALLKRLNNRFGSWLLTFCAYNGSAGAARKWQQRYRKLEPVAFIESIPYAETQTYAKTVFRNWLIYLRLNDKEPIQVPEELLSFSNSQASTGVANKALNLNRNWY